MGTHLLQDRRDVPSARLSFRLRVAVVVLPALAAVGVILSTPRLPQSEAYHRFADELEERLKGDVDMATIDWMWEEYVEIAVNGQRYSDDYRPTGP